jgi:ADP-ribosylation factor-like protein 13B
MKAQNTTSLHPKQSTKLARRKQETYSYFLEKVDPILGECITYLLLEQPPEIPQAMIEFLNKWKESPHGVVPSESLPGLKPKKEMKMFLATNISPVITKLANRIAVKLPADVISFMIEELERMKSEDNLLPETQPQKNQNEEQTSATAKETNGLKSLQIAVLGSDGAGKTSIINAIQGKFDPNVKATIGFRPLSMMLGDNAMIKLYDLGGGKRIRDIWDQYYHDVHGIIYVIDSTDSMDPESEHVQLFAHALNNPFLKGKPLLIFTNKQDRVGEAKSAAEWQDALPVPSDYQDKLFIAECSAYVPPNILEDEQLAASFQADPNLESGIDMLCQSIFQDYDALQQRVLYDCAEKTKIEARKRIERERKVLKNKIAAAFVDSLTDEIRTALQVEPDPSNIFGEAEGLTFLAAEIGEEMENLSPIAVQIAKLTGFSRLALQIVGALNAPISKKKTPMSWMDILTLVLELRAELKLPMPRDED